MLISTQDATVEGVPIAAVALIDELYSRRNFEPAWTDPDLVQQLFDQVLLSVEHGLNPDDFHAAQIGARLRPGPRSYDPFFKADTEILCTDALARLAITLQFGKLNPANLDPAWNFSRKIVRQDPLAYFNEVLNAKAVARTVATLGPQNPHYQWFQTGLRKYRSIMASGGWPTVSPGPVLKVDDSGRRVVELRNRLRVTDPLPTTAPFDLINFDSALEGESNSFNPATASTPMAR